MARLTIDGFVLRFPRTGIVNYVFNVIAELTKLNDFELTVLLEDLNFSDYEISSFVKSRLKTRFLEKISESSSLENQRGDQNLAIALPSAAEVSRAIAPGDVYHATDWYHYPGRYAHANILTYFDLTTKLYPQFHEHTNLVKENRKANAIRGFDHIVAISSSTRADLINHFKVSGDKISVSHLGVDQVYEMPVRIPRKTLLSYYNIDPAHKYILSVCTIEPRKNILGILNAFSRFCEKNPTYRDVRLVLSGHMGWRNESLNDAVASHKYRDNIIFPGYVALDHMPSLYYHAEAFIYLSFYEGFGIPILEAMKSSCPVVCSNTSSMPEVIGDSGELVSPNSSDEAAAALARIFDHSCYADSLRFAGLTRSKRFTWKRHVEDLVQIYRSI